MKPVKYKEFKNVLAGKGFTPIRTSGSHVIFKNDNGTSISVPKKEEISAGVLRNLLKQIA